MEKIILNNESGDMDYELGLIVALFAQPVNDSDENLPCLTIQKKDEHYEVALKDEKGIVVGTKVVLLDEKLHKVHLKRSVYELLSKKWTSLSTWGILVGIRPVKIVHEKLDEGDTFESIREQLINDYLLKPDKADLCIETAQRERPFLYPVDETVVSLYVCIPFCPTRCSYCSFPSNDLLKKGKWLTPYLDALIKEFHFAVQHIEDSGKTIDCIYIGGGTPTVLSAQQFQLLFSEMSKKIDLKKLKEFTVEAGRPDTITKDKLEVLKNNGVSRICVNPQSMQNKTLLEIGRNHLPIDIVNAMALVKSMGFYSINMDLILGLPGEDRMDVRDTVEKVLKMDPDNITVHTLAIKKASLLRENNFITNDDEVVYMQAIADEAIRLNGLTPYYMYRQKNISGHLENIGYAKPNHASLYNMRIMEERHTIVAIGAGAVSKICYPKENRHERVANLKGIEEYLQRFDEVLIKKLFWRQ